MKIALTFDIERDIPNFLDTDFGVKVGLIKILSLLDDYRIKATFFCTGTIVNQQPQVIELIENRGHEIACHSLNHERLSELTFNECKEIISKSKKIIENQCQSSEVLGFRAPYLKPPKFIFKLLNDLGFKYDSSINSRRKSINYHTRNYNVHEFYPTSVYTYFRMPLVFYFIRKWIFKKEVVVLYFHSWEAINIKKLVFKQKDNLNLFKNFFFRLDRWVNTGNSFISRIKTFINEALTNKAEFFTLNQLLTENTMKAK